MATYKKITKNIVKDLKFRAVKSLDIAYVTILSFIFSFYLASLSDVLFYTLYGSNDNNSNYIILLLQISSQFGFIGVLSYIIRNVVQLFPYIFNKYYNYDRSQLYELLRGTLIATFLYLFSPHLQEKIVNLRNYFSNKLTNITKSKNFDKQAQTQNQAQQQTQQQQQQQ
jgi:hypothetical protein